MILLDISSFGQSMMVASYVALLGAFGWLIVTQIKSNKTFSDAINEFRIAIQLLNLQNKNQAHACLRHQAETERHRKKIEDIEIEMTKIKNEKDVKKSNRKMEG